MLHNFQNPPSSQFKQLMLLFMALLFSSLRSFFVVTTNIIDFIKSAQFFSWHAQRILKFDFNFAAFRTRKVLEICLVYVFMSSSNNTTIQRMNIRRAGIDFLSMHRELKKLCERQGSFSSLFEHFLMSCVLFSLTSDLQCNYIWQFFRDFFYILNKNWRMKQNQAIFLHYSVI